MSTIKSDVQVLLVQNAESQNEINWFERTFSKMGKDSLRGSIFIMLLTALGTGIFTLHHIFNEIGIVPSIILVILVGCCFFLASDMLIHSIRHAPKCQSITDLNRQILGKVGFVVYDIIMFVYIMLCLIAGMTSMSKIIYLNFNEYIWQFIHVDDKQKTFEHFNQYFAYVLGFLLFFLVAQREIENLRYFSLYSFFIFVLVVCIFIVQAPLYISDLSDKHENEYNYTDITFNGLFSSFGILLFAYNAIVNFYTVVGTVQNPSVRRLRKIFVRTFAILGLAFIVVGSIAYFCLGKVNTPTVDLFIFRNKIGTTDSLMVIGRSLLILSLATGSGLNAYPLKVMLRSAMGLQNSFKVNFIMSTAIVVFCTIVVSFFTVVTTYVSFAGSFCATLMVFTYPSLIGLKTGYCKTRGTKLLLVLFVIFMTGLGMASSYVSLLKFFDDKK